MKDTVFAQNFVQLTRELGERLGLTDMPTTPATRDATILDFTVDSVSVHILYFAEAKPEEFYVICRFGHLPEIERSKVLERLLEVNFALAGTPASLGIDPEDEQVVLALHSRLAEVTAESLEQSMRLAAAQASQWRQTFYLDAAPAMAPGLFPVMA